MTTHAGAPPLLLRRPKKPRPPHWAPRVSMPAMMPADEATVMTRTSRCATWESSCASTASNSSCDSLPMSPVVTQITARSGERPVAKALGIGTSARPTLGLGMSARAQSRSIMPCSSGCSSGVTSRARIARMARVSELYHCHQAMPRPAIPMITASPGLRTAAISPTTSATNSAPSRNMTVVIRTVRPVSLTNRLLMGQFSPGDQAVAAEQVRDLVQGGVGVRQDQVRGVQTAGVVRRSQGAYAVQQGGQRRPELGVVPRLDRGLHGRVELVEPVERVVGDVVLTLAEDPDDHVSSSAAAPSDD